MTHFCRGCNNYTSSCMCHLTPEERDKKEKEVERRFRMHYLVYHVPRGRTLGVFGTKTSAEWFIENIKSKFDHPEFEISEVEKDPDPESIEE